MNANVDYVYGRKLGPMSQSLKFNNFVILLSTGRLLLIKYPKEVSF